MKASFTLTLALCVLLHAASALAGPDLFIGDTAIYSGTTTSLKPNVLFVIDNSAAMTQAGTSSPYDPSRTYPGSYTNNDVYVRQAATGGTINYNSFIPLASVSCGVAATQLAGSGAYYGPLKRSDGSCTASQSGNYYTGNLLNYVNLAQPVWEANRAYAVGDTVTPPGGGSSYICSQAGTSGSSAPVWPTTSSTAVTDGTVKWVLSPSSILAMVQETVSQVAAATRDTVNIGFMVFGNNNHGGRVVQPVQDISSVSGSANFTSFVNSLDALTLLGGNAQPVNEVLWDSGVYYRGMNSVSSLKISSDTSPYASPVQYSCQKSFVIVLTTGSTPDTQQTKQRMSDLDGGCSASSPFYTMQAGACVGDAADAAIFNYQADSSTATGVQRVQTSVIQMLTSEVPILRHAAEAGHGEYYNVWNTTQLTQALYDAMANIVVSVNTSFVAPVVPVSPENRTYSGSRVYMGFFKPISSQYWQGNLKKYGVNNQNVLVDRNGNLACYNDNNDDNVDDIDGSSLPTGAINGAFRDEASSYWSSSHDAGTVEEGGAGQVLKNASSRNIYTYTGTQNALTHSSNAFNTTNVTTAMLGVGTAGAATSIVNFVKGQDAYDENNNGNITEKRNWFFGDILHSRPHLVSYARYLFNATNESDCSTNKSVIYVGANDGMLHAINDCDGSERWAFIPPDMLGHLTSLAGTSHSYFADATPSVYTYDADNDGIIETGDKVILVFGTRRGGGANSAPTTGSYYALDVSDPAAPTLLWRISNQTAGFEELAETWSEPKLVKMRIDGADKIVAFVGAGYDNIHEDTRFGNTRLFSNAASVILATDVGSGTTASAGSTAATALTNPKGRGVYAIEIATLSSGVPDFTDSGEKIWGFVYNSAATDGRQLMRFSLPAEISAVDTNNNGYADTLYAADAGGQVWKFTVGNETVSSWSGIRLFDLNGGGVSVVGKKFFYKPSVVVETGYNMLFIGSGDREHPLNRHAAQIDRFYALKDRNQTTADNLNETHLTDMTLDQIQTTTATTGASSISGILATLNASYGWYIKLDLRAGEKVLAAPTVFNKVAYFTTFTPDATTSTDPCVPGNLGVSRLYAVDYKTGASVLNYYTANDSDTTTNPLATTTPGQVLVREDRETVLGSGIPSGIVMMITPGGGLRALIGVGGVIAGEDPKKGGSVLPLYWRQK